MCSILVILGSIRLSLVSILTCTPIPKEIKSLKSVPFKSTFSIWTQPSCTQNSAFPPKPKLSNNSTNSSRKPLTRRNNKISWSNFTLVLTHSARSRFWYTWLRNSTPWLRWPKTGTRMYQWRIWSQIILRPTWMLGSYMQWGKGIFTIVSRRSRAQLGSSWQDGQIRCICEATGFM